MKTFIKNYYIEIIMSILIAAITILSGIALATYIYQESINSSVDKYKPLALTDNTGYVLVIYEVK